MLKDNLFEWHFTIRGPADSEFDGGIYHGRIVLPPEYPMKPPSIILLTVRQIQRQHVENFSSQTFHFVYTVLPYLAIYKTVHF